MNAFNAMLISIAAVLALIAIAGFGAGAIGLEYLFGVIIPYFAILVFLVGFFLRLFSWAKSPVPFRIPTSCGQQQSFGWIKQDKLDNPSNRRWVLLRMALEIFFFRSLFRNTKAEIREDGKRIVYESNKLLWAAGLAFHYTFLVVFLRHMRFFADPTPGFVHILEAFDGFFQIGVPVLFMTDLILIAALTFLFLRRVYSAELRYISLPADYFPLFLLLSIATTGVLMRYFVKTDIVSIKALGIGLVSFQPVVTEGVHWLFYAHLFLVCSLIAYFPFSKLMHLGGVFLSPTRNMVNNARFKHHVNPWNYPVKVHTYEEYEDEFRKYMVAMDIPVDKDLEKE